MKSRNSWIRSLALAVVAGSLFQARAELELWDASSGLWPSQASTNWSLRGGNEPLLPTSQATYMELPRTRNNRVQYFEAASEHLVMPNNFTIEFQSRVWNRNVGSDVVSPAAVYFGLGNGLGSVLYLGVDDVWLGGANRTRSVGVSGVDTDDSFHTYRIELSGLSLGSAINIYYDGSVSPLLTGSVFYDLDQNGNINRVGFGDIIREDSGASRWSYLWHNAKYVPIEVVPEPATVGLLIAGGAILLARRNRKCQR